MKNRNSSPADELRPEYNRSDFPKGFVRGKYAARPTEVTRTQWNLLDEHQRRISALRKTWIEGEGCHVTKLDVEAIRRKTRVMRSNFNPNGKRK